MRNPLLTPNVVEYCWRCLARRAGVLPANVPSDSKNISSGTGFDEIGISVIYGEPNSSPNLEPTIYVQPCSSDAWVELLEKPEHTLDWISVAELFPDLGSEYLAEKRAGSTLPILFWGQASKASQTPPIETIAENTVIFRFDIIAATFFMLTRWEETVSSRRDEHDRFPATASVAFKQGFIDLPIIDEYAHILRAYTAKLSPNWQPKEQKFSVKLSHDIDWISHFPSVSYGLKQLFGDVVKRQDLARAKQTQLRLFEDVFLPQQTPQMDGIQKLAMYSEKAGLESAFYFKSSRYSLRDSGYAPGSAMIKKTIDGLRHSGHEIGFHPGYFTLGNPERLAEEKAGLERAINGAVQGGRQHYLRFRVPETWQHWQAVGMSYDSTVGFADHEGFRCGTCHPFTVYDIVKEQELQLVEIPLIVMEGTLRSYRRMGPNEAHQRIIQLARRCAQVNGTFTLLWHNSSLHGDWLSWGNQYPLILQDLEMLLKSSQGIHG